MVWLCLVGLASWGVAFQRIRALSVAELVGDSELVVVAKVAGAVRLGAEGSLVRVKTTFTTERVLKGRWNPATPLTVITLKAPEGQFFENSLDFPPTGERVVLFLTRDDQKAFLPVNGIQGIWPLEKGTDTPLQMGFGKTLKEVEEAVASRTVWRFGDFSVTADEKWIRPGGPDGWELSYEPERYEAGPAPKQSQLVFSEESSAYRSEAERRSIIESRIDAIVKTESTVGTKADKVRLAGVETERLRFGDANYTFYMLFPYNGARVYSLKIVIPGKNAAIGPEVEETLKTVTLAGPAYKASAAPVQTAQTKKPVKEGIRVPPIRPIRESDKAPVRRTFPDDDGCKSSDSPDVPWQKSKAVASPAPVQAPAADIPLLTELSEITPGAYAGAVSAAMEGMRILYGPLGADDEKRFQAKWAPLFDFPSQRIIDYLNKLNPVLAAFLSTRAALAAATEQLDIYWREAQTALAVKDDQGSQEALILAGQQRDLVDSLIVRLNELADKIQTLGNPPDPMRDKCEAAERHRKALNVARKLTPTDLQGVWEQVDEKFEMIQDIHVADRTGDVIGTALGSLSKEAARLYITKVGEAPDGSILFHTYHFLPGENLEVDDKMWEKPRFFHRAKNLVWAFTPDEDGVFLASYYQQLTGNPFMKKLGAQVYNEMGYSPEKYFRWRFEVGDDGTLAVTQKGSYGRDPQRTGKTFLNGVMRWKRVAGTLPAPPATFNLTKVHYPPPTNPSPPPPPEIAESSGPKTDVAAAEKEKERAAAEAAKQERIRFYEGNVAIIRKNLEATEKELLLSTDQEVLAGVQWRIMQQKTDLQAELDRLETVKTGVLVHNRSPFEDYAQQRLVANIQKDQRKLEGFTRAMAAAQRLPANLPYHEALALRKFAARQLSPELIAKMDVDRARQAVDAIYNKVSGYYQGESAKAEERAAWENYLLKSSENIKKGADDTLFVCSLLGGSPATMIAYQGGTGYVEGGVAEGVLRAASWYNTAGFVGAEMFRGFERSAAAGSTTGMAIADAAVDGATALLLAKGFEYLVSSAAGFRNVHLDGERAEMIAHPLTAAERQQSAELMRLMQEGEKRVKDVENAFRKLRQAGEAGAAPAELQQLRKGLRDAAAAAHESNEAKALLKKIQSQAKNAESVEGFVSGLSEIHSETEKKFHSIMKDKGWNQQKLREFRNASSGASVGMDHDVGLVERSFWKRNKDGALVFDPWLTQNGKPASTSRWQADAEEAWEEAYRQVTGRSGKTSGETLTTKGHAEAYADTAWLGDKEWKTAKLWQVKGSRAQQSADVTRYKMWHTLNNPELTELQKIIEITRGAAKDANTKVLPALQEELRRAVPGSKAAEALKGALGQWQAVTEVMSKLGNRAIDPIEGQRLIRQLTGGREVPEVVMQMTMLMESIGKHLGKKR